MNSTSYMFSFVLGLIVVLVFVVVLNSRFHFVNNLFSGATGDRISVISPTPSPARQPSVAPTSSAVRVAQVRPTTAPTRRPSAVPTRTPTTRVVAQAKQPTATPRPTTVASATDAVNQGVKAGQVRGVSQIPNTGFPTEAIPLIAGALVAGVKLRKTS